MNFFLKKKLKKKRGQKKQIHYDKVKIKKNKKKNTWGEFCTLKEF